MATQRLSIPRGDPPGDLVERAVDAVRRGRLIVLPTETVYGLVAAPHDRAMVARIAALKERPADRIFTHHVADRSGLDALCAEPPARIERLLERFWPGPLTVVLPARAGGTVGVRVPAHRFTQAVIQALGHSVYMTSVNRSGAPALITPGEIAREFGDVVELLFDAGTPPLGQASTVVRATGPALEVLREGTLARAEVMEAAAELALFVCTGNTCRSPLCEVIARRRVADALGTSSEQVLAHGIQLASAGTATLGGMPASDNSAAVAAELGLDLGAHRTRPVTVELATRAARIYCMSESHAAAVASLAPGAAARTALLAPSGEEIPDPFGSDLQSYRATRDRIGAALDARLTEIIDLVR